MVSDGTDRLELDTCTRAERVERKCLRSGKRERELETRKLSASCQHLVSSHRLNATMEEFLGPPGQAPSYALESSSGESDWGSEDELAHHAPKSKELAPDTVVEVQGAPRKGGDVIFLVGEAGENLSKGVKVDDEALVKVTVDGQRVSRFRATGAAERH
jgi:hypothetical protein